MNKTYTVFIGFLINPASLHIVHCAFDKPNSGSWRQTLPKCWWYTNIHLQQEILHFMRTLVGYTMECLFRRHVFIFSCRLFVLPLNFFYFVSSVKPFLTCASSWYLVLTINQQFLFILSTDMSTRKIPCVFVIAYKWRYDVIYFCIVTVGNNHNRRRWICATPVTVSEAKSTGKLVRYYFQRKSSYKTCMKLKGNVLS